MKKQLRTKIEQIIRTASLPCGQEGYDRLGCYLSIREYVSPADFNNIYQNIDWLSQDGYKGN